MLNVRNVKALCSPTTYSNGLTICQPENLSDVRQAVVDEDTIEVQGLVQGNFGYFHEVHLTLNRHKSNIVSGYSCDCYEVTQLKPPSPCRHCIALALSLAQEDLEEPADSAQPEAASVHRLPEEMTAVTAFDAPAAEIGLQIPELEDGVPECVPAEEPMPPDPKGMEILFGHRLDSAGEDGDAAALYWTPNDTTRVFHTNTGIIGTMGTGKTQFTKSLITQLYRQQENNFDGSPLGILIFDYKGDYNASKQDFVKATNAKVLRPYQIPFNPLALVEPRVFKPLLPVHTANAFKDTLSKVYRLGPKQQTTLAACILDAYGECGILPENPSTWKNPAPTFEMVNEIYERSEDLAKNDSLAAAMQKLQQFRLFESNPYRTCSLFELLQGVVVIDLSGYDADIQSLVVAITLDQFYAQMHASGSSATDGTLRKLTKLILVDEADNFMSEDFPALKKIMKEGREFGVGTILSTQFLDHFTTGEDNYSRYILTWVVHNVADLKKSDVEYIFKVKANSPEAAAIYDAIKSSDRFQSTVKIGNAEVCRIRDKAFFEL